jgi:hypothetical protein
MSDFVPRPGIPQQHIAHSRLAVPATCMRHTFFFESLCFASKKNSSHHTVLLYSCVITFPLALCHSDPEHSAAHHSTASRCINLHVISVENRDACQGQAAARYPSLRASSPGLDAKGKSLEQNYEEDSFVGPAYPRPSVSGGSK